MLFGEQWLDCLHSQGVSFWLTAEKEGVIFGVTRWAVRDGSHMQHAHPLRAQVSSDRFSQTASE